MSTLTVAAAVLSLTGCFSAPVPEDFVPVVAPPAPPSVAIRDVVRMSDAGLSEDTVIGVIRARGLTGRPRDVDLAQLHAEGVSRPVVRAVLASPVAETPPQRRFTVHYRETWLPLWPAYSRGRWHFGVRIAAYYRETAEGGLEKLPDPAPPEAPVTIDP